MLLRSIAVPICGALLLTVPAMAQSPRYSDDWRPPESGPPATQPAAQPAAPAKPAVPRLYRLLRELDRITTDAERQRAAHPRLLEDMRSLVRRYARRWRRVIVYETFQDRELASNPRWIVRSGEFTVGPHGLVTRVGAAAPVPTYAAPDPAPPPPAAEDQRRPRIGEAIIGSIFEELARDRNGDRDGRYGEQQPAPPVQQAPPPAFSKRQARMRTRADIPNAFVLRVTLRSHDNRSGALEFGVGQGRRASGYRLVYRPGEDRSLRLVRVTKRGREFIRRVGEPIRLEDGQRHKLELARDVVGEMTVALDGRQLLQLRDDTFRDGFDSVVLRNRGGTYTLRGIAVYGTR